MLPRSDMMEGDIVLIQTQMEGMRAAKVFDVNNEPWARFFRDGDPCEIYLTPSDVYINVSDMQRQLDILQEALIRLEGC